MITTLTFCMMLHVKQKNYNNNIYNIYNCNNRELKRFLSSFITTDCFHEAIHTSCSKSFRTQACMKLMNINCEACEQTNCALRKITISTTFMSSSMYLRSLIQPQNEINVPPTKGRRQTRERNRDLSWRLVTSKARSSVSRWETRTAGKTEDGQRKHSR